MAKNKKNLPAAVRFGPALKAALLCLLLGGSAVGYVWQKTQIYELGKQIKARELKLAELKNANDKLRNQLGMLRMPGRLEQRARELNLGLGPPAPAQVVPLSEPAADAPAKRSPAPLYAAQSPRGAERPR